MNGTIFSFCYRLSTMIHLPNRLQVNTDQFIFSKSPEEAPEKRLQEGLENEALAGGSYDLGILFFTLLE